MKCTVYSQDNYISAGIQGLFNDKNLRVKFASAVFIDVMSLPEINVYHEMQIHDADFLVFIVDSAVHFSLLEKIMPLVKNKKSITKYIGKDAQIYEYEDLIRSELLSDYECGNEESAFSTGESLLISLIGSGYTVHEISKKKHINRKILSSWKRSLMRKMSITADITLYDVIMKHIYIKERLSRICY